MARPPVPFEDAEYSGCARTALAHVLVPRGGGPGGDRSLVAYRGEGESAVVFDGTDYEVRAVEDVVIPSSVPGGRLRRPSSPRPRPAERAYWLQHKIYDAIYGQVRRGTILRRLNSPLRVLLPPGDGDASPPSPGEWASVEWIATAETVAVKEMTWEHIRAQRTELAEDPIKEVSAMQYLQRWGERERERNGADAAGGAPPPRRTDAGEGAPSRRNGATEAPHILMPLDLLSDEDEGNLYSITPFCAGGRLLDMVERKLKFSEPEARYWMRQILKGLSCLKRSGVCHRDMSLENLIVHDGSVYIIDFGMCLRIPYAHQGGDISTESQQPQRSLILPQSACGKWYYLSPEVCQSKQAFDGPAVDLWAAGVILFIMLTGQPPWAEPNATDDNFKLMSNGHLVRMLTERRAGLSADALDLLQRMFWSDPADRLSLEQVCAHPWITHGIVLPCRE